MQAWAGAAKGTSKSALRTPGPQARQHAWPAWVVTALSCQTCFYHVVFTMVRCVHKIAKLRSTCPHSPPTNIHYLESDCRLSEAWAVLYVETSTAR